MKNRKVWVSVSYRVTMEKEIAIPISKIMDDFDNIDYGTKIGYRIFSKLKRKHKKNTIQIDYITDEETGEVLFG